MVARLGDVVIDCAHPASLARFWAAVLDDHVVAPYDDEELERLRGMGINSPEDDPSVLLEGTTCSAPTCTARSSGCSGWARRS